MRAEAEPTIRVRIDPTNPGQFFACCGLLELAHRLWGGAEGWFTEQPDLFQLRAAKPQPPGIRLLAELDHCDLSNTMTTRELRRREELRAMPGKEREQNPTLDAEKKALDALWREAPVLLGYPFDLRLDWYLDDRAGGSALKTWAGQQSVIDIARGMREAIGKAEWSSSPAEDWLSLTSAGSGLPFNFDSDLGASGADRDIGFSFDPLKSIRVRTRPVIELAAFVGLQRFRPSMLNREERRFAFSLWFLPLPPEVAAAVACGAAGGAWSQPYEFRLLFRSDYLKSFLPARQQERR